MASGRSWDASGEVGGALQEAIEHFGPRVLSNPRVLENLLSDLIPDETAESRLLVLAAEDDLAGSLGQLCRQVSADQAVRLASSRFAESYPIDADAALWVTVAIARALGHQVGSTVGPPDASAVPRSPWPAAAPTTPDTEPPAAAGQVTVDAATSPRGAPVVPGWPPPTPPSRPGPPTRSRSKVLGILAGVVVLAALGAGGGLLLAGGRQASGVHSTSPPPATTPSTAAPASVPATSDTTPSTSAPRTTTPAMPVAAGATTTNPRLAEQTLGRYFAALNAGDWQAAWATFSPAEQARVSPAQIAQGATGSHDSGVVIAALTANADGSEVATVSFRSTQPPANSPNGSSCDDWHLDYSLVPVGTGYLIDQVAPASTPPYSAC